MKKFISSLFIHSLSTYLLMAIYVDTYLGPKASILSKKKKNHNPAFMEL